MGNRTEQGRELYELGVKLGALGPIAIGSAGGSLAKALARSVGCGAALAGGEVHFHDGSCAACGAWIVKYYSLSASVFVRQYGSRVEVRVADRDGRSFLPQAPNSFAPCTGRWDWLTGSDSGWASRRAAAKYCRGPVAAEGCGALRLLLERMGCDVLSHPQPGVPVLRADAEGFRLTVEWNGMTLMPPGEDALAAAADWLGEGRAIPAFKSELI